MGQSVTVTIGATLGSGFVSSFKTANDTAKLFRTNMLGINRVFDKIDTKAKSVAASFMKMSRGMGVMNTMFSKMIGASVRYQQETARLVSQNNALAASYERMRRDLQRFQEQNRRGEGTGPNTGPNTGRNGNVVVPPSGRGGRLGGFLGEAGGAVGGVGKSAVVGGGSIIGGAIASVVTSSSDFGKVIADTIVTSGESIDFIPQLKKDIFANSGIAQTGQSSMALAEAVQKLVAANRDLKKEAIPSMKTMGMVATATNSNMGDVAGMTNSLLDNFKVAPGQLKAAFNAMAIAGKEGSFEFKDMAAGFPELAGQATALGLTGVEGIMSMTAQMQAVRKGTGTGAEATTNMSNLFASMVNNETKERFQKKTGVSIESLIKGAKAQGKDPLAVLTDFVATRTNNGDAFRVGEMFADKQARDAMLNMIQHRNVAETVRAKQSKGGNVIDEDFQKMIKANPEIALNSLKDSMFKLGNTIATVLAPTVFKLAQFFERVANKVLAFSEAHPALTDAIVKGGVAIGGFLLVGGGLLTVIGSLAGSVSSLTGLWGSLSATFPAFAAKIAAFAPRLLSPFTLIRTALMGLGGVIAGISTPVWVVVGAVVAAGLLIYKYWQPIKAFFIGVWEGIVEGFRPMITEMKPAIDAIGGAFSWLGGKLGELWTWFKGLFGQVDYGQDTLDGAKSAGMSFGKALTWIISPIKLVWTVGKWLWDTISGIVTSFKEWYESSSPMTQKIVDGFMLMLNPIKLLIASYEKLIELKNAWFGHDGQVDKVTGSNGQGFWTIRDKMLQTGAWKKENGDDALDIVKLESMLSSGALKAADLKAVRSVAFNNLGTGDNLDQPFITKLDELIAKQSAKEATSGPTEYTTNITLNGASVTPQQVADANTAAQKRMAEQHAATQGRNQRSDQ